MIIKEQENGSEHRELVTILANSVTKKTTHQCYTYQVGLKCQYLQERAFIINKREYGSEHCEVVTILANSIKNNTPVLQHSG